MVLSNLTMINVGTPFYVAYSSDAPYSGGNLGVGRIIVNGLTVLGAGKTPLYVSAPTNNPAKSIILNNVRMTFAGDADEAASQGQGYSPFSILQSYGLYARNVEDLELHDVRVDFSKTDLRPALFGENIGVLDLDRFQSERAAGGSPSIQAAGIKHLVMDGKEVPVTQVRVVDLETPDGTVTAGQPFRLVAKIQNAGDAGLASLTLRLGKENMPRSIWLDPGESAKVTFINLKPPISGDVELQAGQLTKHLQILSKPEEQAVNAPFRTFHNITADFREVGRNFYIRAAGDYPVMQYADQYGAIYLQQSLPRTGTVIVKLQNPDLATNWLGRAGIMVRSDISKPGQPGGYVVLGSSPAAGSYLEWATDGSGQLNKHTEFEGHTLWPHWLKLERQGSKFTGYSSSNGVQWIRVGEADVPAAKDMLDAGMFVFRTGAQFEDFTIKK